MCRNSFVLLAAVLFLAGCGGSGRDNSEEAIRQMISEGQQVKPTTRVSGKVTIDGEPGNKVMISAFTEAGGTNAVAECSTQPDGTYTWGTYVDGDGLPAGEYRLAFKRSARMRPGSKDMLEGKYQNPMQNDFTLTVVDGEEQTEVNYELTTN